MEGSVIDLSRYRLERAKEDLETAQDNLENKRFQASVNRSYYAIFHALRAVTAMDQFDSSKHAGVISYVNHHYVKSGIFDKSFSKLIDSAYRLREKADYQDFYIVSEKEAIEQIQKAETILKTVEEYLEKKWDMKC